MQEHVQDHYVQVFKFSYNAAQSQGWLHGLQRWLVMLETNRSGVIMVHCLCAFVHYIVKNHYVGALCVAQIADSFHCFVLMTCQPDC